MFANNQHILLIVEDFSDNLYPTTQQLLEQVIAVHGGLSVLDIEQQLLSLFIAAKEQVTLLIKYDTKLLFPMIIALQTKDTSDTIANFREANFLLRNIVDKIDAISQKALELPKALATQKATTIAIIGFFLYIKDPFLPAYYNRHALFDKLLLSPSDFPH